MLKKQNTEKLDDTSPTVAKTNQPVDSSLLQVGLVVAVFAVFPNQLVGVGLVRRVLCHQGDANPQRAAVVVNLSDIDKEKKKEKKKRSLNDSSNDRKQDNSELLTSRFSCNSPLLMLTGKCCSGHFCWSQEVNHLFITKYKKKHQSEIHLGSCKHDFEKCF